MTNEEVQDRLTKLATKLAVPVLNSTAGDTWQLLWQFGYRPAAAILRQEGLSKDQLESALAGYKRLGDIVEPGDLVTLPAALTERMLLDFTNEITANPPTGPQRLNERVVKDITEFRVEMFGNESQHAGRPHVKVHLQDGAISVSLDDPPVKLTPNGEIRGERAALKIISKHRDRLLDLWNVTRPDTQRIPSQVGVDQQAPKVFPLKPGHIFHWLEDGGYIVTNYKGNVFIVDVDLGPEPALHIIADAQTAGDLQKKSVKTYRNRGTTDRAIKLD